MGEMCRICMTAKRNLIKLVKDGSHKLERSGEKFEDCFGIKIKQIQNCQKICRTCEQTLIEFYYFKQQALRTHNYLIDKAVSLPVDHHEIKKLGDSDCTKISDDEESCSNVEFFNIEYLDEEAVDVDLMLPLPKIESIPEFENLEIKQEKIDEHDEDCVENATSENFDEGTIFGYTNESQTDLIADYDDESLENSIFMEDQEEELSKLSEKDQSDEENSKETFKKYFKRSVRYRHRCEECVRNFKSDKAYKEHLKRHKEEDGYIPTEDELAVSRQNISQKNKKKYSKKSRFKHKCNECGKNFLHDFSYEAHKNVHKGLAPFNCDICGKGFKQKINYTYHMKNHLGKRDWKCDICGKAFLVKWDLDLHMRSHTDARPFMCDICGKGFRISTHLTNHRETHNETNIYECHLCKTRLHTKITLKRHMASLHKIGKLKHCPYCDKEFVRLDRFKSYKCDECNLVFTTYQAHSDHINKHRKDLKGDTRLRPETSNFNSDKNMNKHLNPQKPNKWKTSGKYYYRCDECKKPFNKEDSFKAHLNFHKGILPWGCEICGKRFKGKGRYMYHMKNHYGQRDWKCNICDKAFLIKWDLRLHMRTHNDDRPYICEICGKGFRIYCNLVNHRECHNETNTYECDICQAKLHTNITYRRHIDTVHKIDLSISKTCPLCNQNFTLLRRYEDHMKRCHPDVELI